MRNSRLADDNLKGNIKKYICLIKKNRVVFQTA